MFLLRRVRQTPDARQFHRAARLALLQGRLPSVVFAQMLCVPFAHQGRKLDVLIGFLTILLTLELLLALVESNQRTGQAMAQRLLPLHTLQYTAGGEEFLREEWSAVLRKGLHGLVQSKVLAMQEADRRRPPDYGDGTSLSPGVLPVHGVREAVVARQLQGVRGEAVLRQGLPQSLLAQVHRLQVAHH